MHVKLSPVLCDTCGRNLLLDCLTRDCDLELFDGSQLRNTFLKWLLIGAAVGLTSLLLYPSQLSN